MISIAIIPCFKVKSKIISVLKKSCFFFDLVICVDDKCPQKTGEFIKKKFKNKKIIVLKNKKNLGVGGALKTGFKYCKKFNPKVIVKLDGDNQINPQEANKISKKLIHSHFDYAVGSRFKNRKNYRRMPWTRWYGNKFLSYISRISSGLYHIDDFLNGLIAIKYEKLKDINLNNVKNDFRFETSMLFNASKKKFKISSIPMNVKYFKKRSNFNPVNEFISFALFNLFNFFQRVYEEYFKKINFGSFSLVISFLIFFKFTKKIFYLNYFDKGLLYFMIFFILIFFVIDISRKKEE